MLFLSAHDFLMRRFRQTGHAFGFGFALTEFSGGLVAVMLMHLFLMLVKIEFVQARARADLVSLDVPCLTSHDCSLRSRMSCLLTASSQEFLLLSAGSVCSYQ